MCRRQAVHAYAPLSLGRNATANEQRQLRLEARLSQLRVTLCGDLITTLFTMFLMAVCTKVRADSQVLQADYELTQSYTGVLCAPNPTLVEYVEQPGLLEAGHAQVSTTFYFPSSPNTTRTVRLYYPPLWHWRLYGTNIRLVNRWIESMMNNPESYVCRVDTTAQTAQMVQAAQATQATQATQAAQAAQATQATQAAQEPKFYYGVVTLADTPPWMTKWLFTVFLLVGAAFLLYSLAKLAIDVQDYLHLRSGAWFSPMNQ